MRKILAAVAAAACALTASAASAPYVDPNPYAGYGPAMKSTAENPLAANWSRENDSAIAAATEESVLAGFVSDAASADALLAQLKGAYETDPIVMTQIAAVTQWVMLPDPFFLFFWKPFPSSGRVVWREALERRASSTTDDYVRTFCAQQLELCR